MYTFYDVMPCKGASPNDFCTFSVIVTLRGGGGPGHDVKKKINLERIHESIMENPTPARPI